MNPRVGRIVNTPSMNVTQGRTLKINQTDAQAFEQHRQYIKWLLEKPTDLASDTERYLNSVFNGLNKIGAVEYIKRELKREPLFVQLWKKLLSIFK